VGLGLGLGLGFRTSNKASKEDQRPDKVNDATRCVIQRPDQSKDQTDKSKGQETDKSKDQTDKDATTTSKMRPDQRPHKIQPPDKKISKTRETFDYGRFCPNARLP
jgi:hypothetical protein